MNCAQCGHDVSDHLSRVGCCFEDEYHDMTCTCKQEPADIELAAYKAEAMAAREFVGYFYGNDPDFDYDENAVRLYQEYQAARVKDGE